jgi:hypothetical protein
VSESALQKPFLLLQTAEKDSLLILLFFLSYPLESISVVFSFPSKQHRSSEISSYFHFSSKPQDTDLLQDEAYNLPPSYLYLPSPADDPGNTQCTIDSAVKEKIQKYLSGLGN